MLAGGSDGILVCDQIRCWFLGLLICSTSLVLFFSLGGTVERALTIGSIALEKTAGSGLCLIWH